MERLLDTLIPPDDPLEEDLAQQEVRRTNTTPISQNIEPPISIEELDLALKKIKLRKAPGPDRIHPEILINLDLGNRLDFLALLSSLVEKRNYFLKPGRLQNKIYKESWQQRLPAHTDRSASCQVYERIIRRRLTLHLELNALLSQHQYGFREKRSTVQAIEFLKDAAMTSPQTYVAVVLIDIQGAFDSPWWPEILKT